MLYISWKGTLMDRYNNHFSEDGPRGNCLYAKRNGTRGGSSPVWGTQWPLKAVLERSCSRIIDCWTVLNWRPRQRLILLSCPCSGHSPLTNSKNEWATEAQPQLDPVSSKSSRFAVPTRTQQFFMQSSAATVGIFFSVL
jgi:hypothetical protein